MSAGEHVREAQQWANALTDNERRGGTLEATWRRLEAMFSIPSQTFWALRYRPPKRIAADLHTKLRLAYLQQCERLVRSAQHDIEILRAIGRANHADLESIDAQAQELVGQIEQAKRAS